MSYVVRMPKLGLEMTEGTVIEWKVDPGEEVEAGMVLLEIESEKTTADVDAREGGVLRERFVEVEETVEPGTALGIVAPADEDISELIAAARGGGDEASSEAEPTGESTESRASSGGDEDKSGDDVKATPRAKRRARELGVDLSTVEGTGPMGAVSESDVEAAAADGGESDDAPDDGADDSADEEPGGKPTRTVTTEGKLGPTRRTIADRLGESYREAVHVTVHRSVDAAALLEATEAADDASDANVALTDLLLACVSATLAEHPEFNATFEDGIHRQYEEHNVGVAVDTDSGLLAPVLGDVGSLSVPEITSKRRGLTDRVLSGEHTGADLAGGTFTVTNLGTFGVEAFDPIINPPQVAILGVNALEERATRGEDGVEFRQFLPLSLSFDHRVVDGADAARFLGTLTEEIRDPWHHVADLGVEPGQHQ